MAGPIAISIIGDERDLMRSLGKSEAGLSSLGKTSGKVGTAVKIGVAAAGAAIIKLGIDSVKAASDAQQSLGATETVFKDYADTVIKRSEAAADAYGLSANAYRESANLIGSLFKNQGVELDQLGKKTDDMIGVAADLAATFGGTTADAVGALSAAFKGEFDSLEKYGVSLKASTISAALAEKGQDKLTGSALDLAKQVATTEEILRQSSDAQGAFARESDTLAGAQQRFSAEIENVKARLGTLLLPALTDLTRYGSTKVVPMLEDMVGFLEDNKDEIGAFARDLKNTAVPILRTTAEVTGTLLDMFMSLPAPVREIGLEVGIAALAFGRLRTATATLGLANLITNLKSAETRTAALGTAAKGAAGIGGLALLMQASRETNRSMSTLEGAAGGAALGFAIGGPWGAAIGGGAGALYGLVQSTDASSESFRNAVPPVANYTEHINAATGAVSRLGREQIVNDLRTRGAIEDANTLGISTLTLVKAVQGHEGAQLSLNRTLAKSQNFQGRFKNQTEESYEASRDLENQMVILAGAMHKSRREAEENAVALGEFKKILPDIPKKVLTELALKGAGGAEERITKIARLYDITDRRKIRALIELSGAEVTRSSIRGILESLGLVEPKAKETRESLRDVGRTKADTAPWRDSLFSALTGAGRDVDKRVEGIAGLMGEEVGKGKADLGPFRGSLLGALASLAGDARAGGAGVTNAMGEGMVNALTPFEARMAAAARGIVRNAIVAARLEAQVASPSKKTRELGRLMGEGLRLGLLESTRDTENAARDHVRRTLRAGALASTTYTRPPRLSSGVGGRGGTVRVILTADQLSRLERGREIALDLAAYEGKGGKR